MTTADKKPGIDKPEFDGEWVRLGDVVLASKERNHDLTCEYVYSVTNSRGFTPSTEYFSKEVFSDDLKAYRVVRRRMIAYNPSRINVGSVALQDELPEVVVSPLYVVLSVDEKRLLPEYLLAFLKSGPGLAQIAFRSTGTVRNNLKFETLCKLEMQLPSVKVQRERVNLLAEIAKQAKHLGKLRTSLDDLVKSRFVEMFGDERNYTKLGDQCSKITKGTTPTTVGFQFQNEGVNFIKIESIGDNGQILLGKMAHIGESCHAALLRSRLEAGDLLFSIAGAIGRTAIVPDAVLPANTNQALAIIRLRSDAPLDKTYLRFALSSDAIRMASAKTKRGIAQINLSLKDVSDFRVPLPSLALQRQFADFVAQVDKLGFDVQQQIEKLEILKQSLMQEYFG